MPFCLLCLGSNTDAEKNFQTARTLLAERFPNALTWEEARWTEPVNFPLNPAHFLNQTARLETSLTPKELQTLFKEIEKQCGRLPEEKSLGIVRMDIDLITYDGQTIKVLPF